MGTFLVLDIPKVPSDSTIWELRKSIFGIFGIKNLSRLDSRDMCNSWHVKWNQTAAQSYMKSNIFRRRPTRKRLHSYFLHPTKFFGKLDKN